MSGTQQFVYQKWPKTNPPLVNVVFSHNSHFGLEGGGSVGGGGGGRKQRPDATCEGKNG